MDGIYVAPTGGTTSTDIQCIFFGLTLDTATDFLAQKPLSPIQSKIRKLYVLSVLHLDGLLPCCTAKESGNQAGRSMHLLINLCIRPFDPSQKKLEEANTRHADKTRYIFLRYIFLDALLAETQDPIELCSQYLNILLAGRDTTAPLLSWTVMLSARHSAAFNKLREDIIQSFGTYGSPRDINFSSLKSCQYLQFCLKESLCLFPVVHSTAVRQFWLQHCHMEGGQTAKLLCKALTSCTVARTFGAPTLTASILSVGVDGKLVRSIFLLTGGHASAVDSNLPSLKQDIYWFIWYSVSIKLKTIILGARFATA
ncbi:hypothetical protein N7481_003307 [Penicillium waksmanii]|uniref:uncharacterized protein n=1 Tax=Penicillium waksmanii TaxID=69791 RepID=UPI002546F6AE|nr:uncharacterized protein N7481_003307 [Penicillium waksmanii]KAJ5988097.1 hypothetical protein N7481_003307 [Penicillium waksmanii]